MLPLAILFGVAICLGAGLLIYANKMPKRAAPKLSYSFNESVSHIKDIYRIDDINRGAIRKDDAYLLMARIEGINFTVMSETEQNMREEALVSIFTRLDYPIRFISGTVVADTSEEASSIAQIASATPESNLKTYRTLYAGALEMMRLQRKILTQQTFTVIPGKTREEAEERLSLFASSLQSATPAIVTSVSTTDEAYSVLQDILMPDKILKPAEIAASGVITPVHFTEKEVESYAAKFAHAGNTGTVHA